MSQERSIAMTAAVRQSTSRLAWLVFGILSTLYLLTAGGQGYSVDGTFSYEVANSLANDPTQSFVRRNAETLRRWGPVMPLLGTPLTWLGARLGEAVPFRDSVVFGDQTVRLYEWPPIEPVGGSGQLELRLDLPSTTRDIHRVRLVSFLSFGAEIPDGTPVAEMELLGSPGADQLVLGRARLFAGRDTAEWAYDLPGAPQPQHPRARVAGHWPGNPSANLYVTDLDVSSRNAAPASAIRIRSLTPSGRLHVRSASVLSNAGWIDLAGPSGWSGGDQQALFSRYGFSFLNVPVVAATCALLVPLAVLLGYSAVAGVLLALGAGVSTMLWPYAKHDFSEPLVGFFLSCAVVLLLAAHAAASRRRQDVLLFLAGASAALAVGTKYASLFVLPLLGIQLVLLWWPSQRVKGTRRFVAETARRVGVFCLPSIIAAAGVLLVLGRMPILWANWRGGLERGWLDFPLWNGLYGLLLSPGKSLFLYSPPLLLALIGAALFFRRHRERAFIFLALPLVYLLVYGSKGVWHGGGWGPRYLVPVVPFLAIITLPVVARAVSTGWRWWRISGAALLLAGIAVQWLGVAKHPNLYTVMFRDHIAPALPDYGVRLGGAAAETYWHHFGGLDAARQLARPPHDSDPSSPQRGLGYLYAEEGPLIVRLDRRTDAPFAVTAYVCDWDQRGRRQRLTLSGATTAQTHVQANDFSDCEYLTWLIAAAAGPALTLRVEEVTGRDVPVISALFFDPVIPGAAGFQTPMYRTEADGQDWPARFGNDGYMLFAWNRGVDVSRLPSYVASVQGGDRVWLDTGEAELTETPLLYVPGFSPLLAHAWLLAADLIAAAMPANNDLRQRALASPPWRYLSGMEIHSPHPEYGLGLDFWPLLLRSHFRSHVGFMAVVWLVVVGLASIGVLCCWSLYRLLRPIPLGRHAIAGPVLPASGWQRA